MMTAPPVHPQLHARVVLFDLDDTLVTNGPTDAVVDDGGDPFITELTTLVSHTHAVDVTAAAARVRTHLNANGPNLLDSLDQLEVDATQFVNAMIRRLRSRVRPFPDAVETVRALHARGYRLYPATTNSRIACLVKLAIAGLGDAAGSKYFRALFGGAEVVPEGKTTPLFYQALLERIGATPEEVVMVGDDVTNDLALARAAGIRQVVLLRRDQPERFVLGDDGAIYVRRLTWLADALPERAAPPPTAEATPD